MFKHSHQWFTEVSLICTISAVFLNFSWIQIFLSMNQLRSFHIQNHFFHSILFSFDFFKQKTVIQNGVAAKRRFVNILFKNVLFFNNESLISFFSKRNFLHSYLFNGSTFYFLFFLAESNKFKCWYFLKFSRFQSNKAISVQFNLTFLFQCFNRFILYSISQFSKSNSFSIFDE